jgi:hypothetical protein
MAISLIERLLNEDSVRLGELPTSLRKRAASLLKRGRAYYDSEKEVIRDTKRGDCCVSINDSPENIKKYLGESTRFVHLQGIGKTPAILVRELKPGDILSWNQSPESHVVKTISPVSPQYYSVSMEDIKTGENYVRKMRRDKLVSAKRAKAVD